MPFKKLLLPGAFVTISFFAFSNDSLSPPTLLSIQRAISTVQFDGIPNEPAWQHCTSLSFYVLEPVWGTAPAEKTEVLFLFDDDNLYVGGKCFYKDPSKIVARNFIKDGWRGDDWFGVHIDSRFDHQTAFNLAVYPAGSRFDALISNDGVDLGSPSQTSSFNAFWDARSVITGEGWFFEMKIPLFNLRYKITPEGSVQMAISATRWTSYNNELQQSVKIPQGIGNGFLKPSLKQEAVFTGLKRHKMFLFTPYVAASTYTNNAYSDELNKVLPDKRQKLTGGFDTKISLSQYLTLDATVNPDFGQAEADLQQLNLSRFSLYLPEKRLFFQEQSGLFDFSLGSNAQLFYSRRIGLSDDGIIPLYGGLRLTGQVNNTTDIGLLNMQSEQKRLNDSVLAPSENYGAFRLRKKILNDRSFAGLLFTNRNSSVSSNYVLGADAVLNVSGNNYLKISVAGSHTKDSVTYTTVGLHATRISLSWEDLGEKGWIPKLGYTFSGRNFDPQLGFLDRTNFHTINAELAYGVFARSSKQRFSSQKFSLLKATVYKNAATGKTESISAGSEWKSYTVKGTGFTLNTMFNYEYVKDALGFGNGIIISPGAYRFPSFLFLMMPPSAKKIAFPVGFGGGGFFGGQKYFFSFSPNVNSAQKIQITPGYDYTYLHFPKSSNNNSTHIHIARLKITYAPNLHFNAIFNMQYNSTEQKVFTNFRLQYNFSDGHDLYFVWNNNSRTNTNINDVQYPVTEQQQLLVKYYYTFKFTGAAAK